jgi:hypothetical protein
MHLGDTTTIDLSAWGNPGTMPVPTSGMAVTCPGPGCPNNPEFVSPQQNAIDLAMSCNCVNGTCVENGNSCSTSYIPQGPLTSIPSATWIAGVSNSMVLLISAAVVGFILMGRNR